MTRSLAMVNVDIAVLQEVKIVDPKFATRKYGGYDVVTAAAGRDTHGKAGGACGGVALIVREDTDRFAVENAEVVGENVISCEMVTGSGKGEGDETRWFVVGFYCPPPGEGRRDAAAGGADAEEPAAGDTPLPPRRLER